MQHITSSTLPNWISCPISADLYIPNRCACISISYRRNCSTESSLIQESCRISITLYNTTCWSSLLIQYYITTYYIIYSTKLNELFDLRRSLHTKQACLHFYSCRHTCLTESSLVEFLFTSYHQENTIHRNIDPCLNHGNHILHFIVMSIVVKLTKPCIMISLVATLPINKFVIYLMFFSPYSHLYYIIIIHWIRYFVSWFHCHCW